MTDSSLTLPHTAMVFAAGLGKRMRDYRDDIPKPLVPVAGRALIDHVLDKLVQTGVQRAVVNVSYLAEQITAHLSSRQDIEIIFSREDTPLETGGGLLHALPHLGAAPVYVVNSDIGWLDGEVPALQRLANSFDAERMDAVLLLCPREQTVGYTGQGDFTVHADGWVQWCHQKPCPYVYTGVQLLHPRIIQAYAPQAAQPEFSLWKLFGDADAGDVLRRVQTLIHDHKWLHIGDAEGVQAAEGCLREQ